MTKILTVTKCQGMQMPMGLKGSCKTVGHTRLNQCEEVILEAAQWCADGFSLQARPAGVASGAGHAHRGGLLRACCGEGQRLPRLDPDAFPLGPLPRPHRALQGRLRSPADLQCQRAEAMT